MAEDPVAYQAIYKPYMSPVYLQGRSKSPTIETPQFYCLSDRLVHLNKIWKIGKERYSQNIFRAKFNAYSSHCSKCFGTFTRKTRFSFLTSQHNNRFKVCTNFDHLLLQLAKIFIFSPSIVLLTLEILLGLRSKCVHCMQAMLCIWEYVFVRECGPVQPSKILLSASKIN